MANIKVTPEELQMLYLGFESASRKVYENIQDIERLLCKLDTAWQGDASCSYIGMANRKVENCKELAVALSELSHMLRDAHYKYQQAERSMADALTSKLY